MVELTLTSTLLFVLLNIIIGTIFLISLFTTPPPRPQLTRATSFLSRVTSFGRPSSPTEPVPPINPTQHHSHHTTTPSLLIKEPPTGPPEVPNSSSSGLLGLSQAQHPSVGPPEVPDSSSSSGLLGLSQAQHPSVGPPPVVSESPSSVCMAQPNKVGRESDNREVDAEADDFINKFKHQLKLQRLKSLLRYRNNSDS